MQASDSRRHFGARLKFLRGLENITQAEMAQRADISIEHVGKLERGVASPSFNVIMALARALHTEPANLFLFAETPPEGKAGSAGETAFDSTRYVTGFGTFEEDLELGRVFWSDSLFRLLGYNTAAGLAPGFGFLAGHAVAEDRRAVAGLRAAILVSPRDMGATSFRLIRRDGSLRRVMFAWERRMGPAGGVAGIAGVILDITEQKRLEQYLLNTQRSLEERVRERTKDLKKIVTMLGEEIGERKKTAKLLKKSRRLYRTIFETVPKGMFRSSLDGRFLVVNPAFAEMFGFASPGEVVEKVLDIAGQIYVEPATRGRIIERLKKEGGPISLVSRYKRADGSEFEAKVDAALMRDGEGAEPEIVGMVEDVTRVREAQKALAKSEERYRLLAENAHDVIWSINEDLKLTYVSPSVERLIGYTPEEMLRYGPEVFFSRESFAKVREAVAGGHYREGRETGDDKVSIWERVCNARDGREVLVETRTEIVWDEQGRFRGITGVTRDVTERRKADEALRQSEERFRLVLESAPGVAVQGYTADGTVFFWNSTNEAVYGYTAKEALGKNLLDLIIPPEMREQVGGLIARGVATGEMPPPGELRLMRKDGSPAPVYSSHAVVRPPDSEPVLFCMDIDLTERIRMEEEIRRSESKYRILAENMEDAVWVLDPELKLTYASPSIAGLLGLHGECRPEGGAEDLPPEEFFSALRREIAERGGGSPKDGWRESLRLTTRVERPDGSPAWIESVCTPVFSDNGGIAGYQGVSRDVSDRQEAEEALKEQLALFEKVFYFSPMGMAISRLRGGGYVRVNRRFTEILGYSEEEALGKTALELGLIPPDATYGSAAEMLEGLGRVSNMESVFTAKDGRRVPVILSMMPITFLGEECVLSAGAEITERKRLEEELLKASSRAEESSRLKSEFLASMSHEVRTPLSGLLGMMNLLTMGRLDKEQRELVEAALEAGRGLLSIINDILDFSKIEAGKVDIVEKPFDPREVLRAVVRLYEEQADAKGLDLMVSLNGPIPEEVLGDEGRVLQIVANLTSNAVKYTREGEVSISLESIPGRRPGTARLFFTVEDTGPGIPRDVLPVIFEPFLTGDSKAAKIMGTGLGLSISRRLAKHMGADLMIESGRGAGTTGRFSIELPALGKPERTGTPPASRPVPSVPVAGRNRAGTDGGGKPLTILVAEDDWANRMSVARFLTSLGHTVVTARNGGEALEKFADHAVDLVLMDIQMPGMDGVEATRLIRARNARGGKVPVVALTAHAMRGDKERFMEAGMDAYLGKPVEFETLRALIEKLAIAT